MSTPLALLSPTTSPDVWDQSRKSQQPPILIPFQTPNWPSSYHRANLIRFLNPLRHHWRFCRPWRSRTELLVKDEFFRIFSNLGQCWGQLYRGRATMWKSNPIKRNGSIINIVKSTCERCHEAIAPEKRLRFHSPAVVCSSGQALHVPELHLCVWIYCLLIGTNKQILSSHLKYWCFLIID